MHYKNLVFEKVKESGSITDTSLTKSLTKDGYLLHEDVINKALLDLEIMGLINVTWLNKNTRRIEIVSNKNEEDDVELENKKSLENDYESSFPATKSDLSLNLKWKAASKAIPIKIIVRYGAVTLYAFHAKSDVGVFVSL